MLTLEERERRAYIEGRVEEAALIAEVVDEASLLFEDELHDLRGRLDDAQNVARGLRAQIIAAVRALS
jgi:hypothetical protein